jgi:hypothetical protein
VTGVRPRTDEIRRPNPEARIPKHNQRASPRISALGFRDFWGFANRPTKTPFSISRFNRRSYYHCMHPFPLAFFAAVTILQASEPKMTPATTADSEGFIPLLGDGMLKQWRQCGSGRFFVTNGVATGEGGMGLWWFGGRQFTNFVLRGEFVQEQPIADSGVFVRFPDPGNDPWQAVHRGHEVEIGDPDPKDPTWRTGSIYPFQASTKANTKPPGQWNAYEIMCEGQHYSVRINGLLVTSWVDPDQRTSAGYVGLQNYNDGKTVRHRNLRIKELASQPK